MVRPRFAKLPPAQQQAILSVALEEFAAHGFHDASLNRVIESAGISKGSMYYYFDGKEDLYAHVARVELERMVARVGPFDIPAAGDPDAFWSALENYYLQLMSALETAPKLAALIRGWIATSATPAMQQIQQEMEKAVIPWMGRSSCGRAADRSGEDRYAVRPVDRRRRGHGPGDGHLAADPVN